MEGYNINVVEYVMIYEIGYCVGFCYIDWFSCVSCG